MTDRKRLSVIHTVPSLSASHGGPPRTVPGLCRGLQSLGTSVGIVALDTDRWHGPASVSEGEALDITRVTCRVFPRLHAVWAPRFRGALVTSCRDHEAGLIHGHGVWLPTHRATVRVARELNIPLVVTPRGMLTAWAFSYKGWKKRLAWRLYQRRDIAHAQVLHATSVQEADDLRALGLKQPIALIPNAVDVPERGEPAGRPGGRRTALFLSRVHRTKGLLSLVKAWAALRPEGWRMVVAGPDEGGYRAEVEMAARREGLEDVFSFPGPVYGEARWDLYRRSDLFVLPTFSENFGVVVAEALACGIPVITTKGAPWEELLSEECGWWVDIGPEPLAEALREAISLSDDERREMGVRGRRLIEKRYTWPRVASRMIEVYRWILSGGPPPECVMLS